MMTVTQLQKLTQQEHDIDEAWEWYVKATKNPHASEEAIEGAYQHFLRITHIALQEQ